MKKFNINQYVRVKLTDAGIEELKRQHEELRELVPSIGEFKAKETDEDGMTRFQLWVLMSQLGHMCTQTGPEPFEMDIIFEDRDLRSMD
jgi:hypothetical protein